jgi:hypothetical protein
MDPTEYSTASSKKHYDFTYMALKIVLKLKCSGKRNGSNNNGNRVMDASQ